MTHGGITATAKRANLVLVWDAEELFSMGLPDQGQSVTILLVSAMLAAMPRSHA